MRNFIVIFTVLFYTLSLHAYSDYDVDGVDDAIDLCPHTPFDELADQNGCSKNETPQGTVTLMAGWLQSRDPKSETINNLLFYADYQYRQWNISFSTFNAIQNDNAQLPDTYYLSAAYEKVHTDSVIMKLLGGVKFSSLQNDYYAGLSFYYQVEESLSLFGYYTYTYASDTAETAYANYHTVSGGLSKEINNRWSLSFTYDFATASLPDVSNYQALTLSNTIVLTSNQFLLANYTAGIGTAAPKQTIILQYGVRF